MAAAPQHDGAANSQLNYHNEVNPDNNEVKTACGLAIPCQIHKSCGSRVSHMQKRALFDWSIFSK
jgi:hypothetical protein